MESCIKSLNRLYWLLMSDYYKPVFLKSLDGSVRDIKSLRKVLEEINFTGVLVMDRGFASYSLADEINNKFIMPLRRNNRIIDYNAIFKSSFMYRDRGILSTSYRYGKYNIYIFQDQLLMSEEANTFISLIADKKKNQEDFNNASFTDNLSVNPAALMRTNIE